jgi:hypothetical protein
MKNLKTLKSLKNEIELLRTKIIDASLALKVDNNYDLIFDSLETDVESDLCNLLSTFEMLIEEVEDIN